MAIKAENRVAFKILQDGTISVDTGSFEDGIVHLQAEQMIKETISLTGGEHSIKKKNPNDHQHTHVHSHEHHKA